MSFQPLENVPYVLAQILSFFDRLNVTKTETTKQKYFTQLSTYLQQMCDVGIHSKRLAKVKTHIEENQSIFDPR